MHPATAAFLQSLRALCDRHGLLLNAPRPSVLRFMPALNVARVEVDLMIEGLTGSLNVLGIGTEATST